jgi:ABC-type sugar transport system substrate-binding protein
MKSIIRKVVSMLLVVLIVASLAACGNTAPAATPGAPNESSAAPSSSDSSKPDLVKVAYIPGDMANESQAFSAKMFQKHAAEYGFDVTILDGKADAQVQANAVNNAVAQGMKAIYVNPNDINAIIPSLNAARKAGVIVGMFSSDLPAESADARDFFVGVNDNMAGETAAKAFMDKFPDGAKIVEIGGQAGHDAQIKRHDGFNNSIKGSKIEVVGYQATQAWSTAEAMAIMEDFIVKYGDEIQGVFCHWDNGGTGIIEAMKAAGMKDIFMVAVDGCRAGFDQVKEGTQAVTIAQNFEAHAELCLKLTNDMLEGKTIEPVNFIPLDIVSLENIDTFTYPEW